MIVFVSLKCRATTRSRRTARRDLSERRKGRGRGSWGSSRTYLERVGRDGPGGEPADVHFRAPDAVERSARATALVHARLDFARAQHVTAVERAAVL